MSAEIVDLAEYRGGTPTAVELGTPLPEIATVSPVHYEAIGRLGVTLTDSVRFDTGLTYKRRLYTPADPRYETPVSMDTPWGTDLDGIDDDVAKLLMAAGVTVASIEAPTVQLADVSHLTRLVSLADDARAHHAILNDYQERYGVPTEHIINYGFSRGAMVGLAVTSTAVDYQRQVDYFEYVDPTVEHRLSDTDRQPADVLDYLGHEAMALLFSGLTEHGARRVAHALWSSRHLLQHAAVGYSIFSGNTGDFARQIPPSAAGHITFFDHSRWNHAAEYRRDLMGCSDIAFNTIKGYHTPSNRPAVWKASVQRILAHQARLAFVS